MSLWKEFTKGVLRENPLFVLVLGMCPSLAITTSVANGIGMGVAFTGVLLASNIVISMLRKVIPNSIRIPSYIVIIATFVTMVEMLLHAYSPALFKSLGVFIPLIVVNCIILGRAEAFASKNGLTRSILDALGMGLGFTFALVTISTFREVLGAGTFLGMPVFGDSFQSALIMILPPGAFITLGCILAFINKMQSMKAAKRTMVGQQVAQQQLSSN
ncbi:MAG TPA: electron transport complex subunit E [Peptococcaceae bacterium]|jgi:electron transport complex protein RnfE|nr:electron transport complex subunit E [Clostridia bacterium]HOB81547.1 electron transport complex subunit E [Peptococcaceae bacterium]HPZ71940.1 electron transport complex subunit E [Peptococcaceae bacterium]HQD53635.1 electron transport complex subunit E [Peptococcaceae bacterium]